MRERIRMALRRPLPEPIESDPAPLVHRPGDCRTCTNRADVQLSPDLVTTETVGLIPNELLCWNCLTPFLETFADPRVATWLVTRIR
jgi:hypothetical protein